MEGQLETIASEAISPSIKTFFVFVLSIDFSFNPTVLFGAALFDFGKNGEKVGDRSVENKKNCWFLLKK